MFSGIGGFRQGLEYAGHECVGHCEIDKYAHKLYSSYYDTENKGEVYYDDATTIDPKGLPDFDIITGGFPCQAFSIAGSRGGFEDTRGTLFFDIARVIEYKRPKLVFLENVKGLLNHAKGETFRVILTTLDDLGYDVEWMVLNSKDYGVPQNRERVFIIGHLRGQRRRKVFPLTISNGKDTRRTGEDLSYCLDANYWKGTNTTLKGRRQLIQMNAPTHSKNRVYGIDGISPTLNTMQGGGRQPYVCGALDTVRRLTPLECFRLQGFQDDMVQHGIDIGISNTQLYKMAGNSVTVNVIKAIARQL